jgi:hypothetical protein
LMFRFPKGLIDVTMLKPYTYAEEIEVITTDKHVILDIEPYNEEGGWGWIEGEGLLSGMVSLRQDIMQGDLRALYLAWLMVAASEVEVLEDDEDLTEPPVPPNLQNLSAALENLIDFFEIDRDLVDAAAEASPLVAAPSEDLEKRIGDLTADEKDGLLRKVLRGDPHVSLELARKLRELGPTRQRVTAAPVPRRTIKQLNKAAKEHARIRKQREREEAERERVKKLKALAPKEEEVWGNVHSLIKAKHGKAYDEAVQFLIQLRDLAEYQKRSDHFNERINQIYESYPTLRGLHDRMRRAGLDKK